MNQSSLPPTSSQVTTAPASTGKSCSNRRSGLAELRTGQSGGQDGRKQGMGQGYRASGISSLIFMKNQG
ncbi:hypothetical protein BRADI_4g19595v3 [Brachypodium distachyon]|uniref:Uncharacterized protein n=1 Tax=Brachypodium distachyon TaxID=15368 RepID=A0A0Q3H531_BRADI|nr:hypothetical protein BRADI_4g19595v3 [Brachypodium distachyon]